MVPDHWYPGADKGHRYDKTLGGTVFGTPNKVVLHSTEGLGLPPYKGGTQAPHITVLPNLTLKRLEIVQHFPFNMNSRALRNPAGGVETNHARAVQIEIVGTCVRATHFAWINARHPHLYMPELPAWVLHDLGKFMEWFNWRYGIPFTHANFLSYEQLSPGAVSVRMTTAHWTRFRGWCGHQHVPENGHLDPGNIPIETIVAYAEAYKEDRNMPTAKEIADAVVNAKVVNRTDGKPDTETTVGGALTDMERSQDRYQKETNARFDVLEAKIDALKGTPA